MNYIKNYIKKIIDFDLEKWWSKFSKNIKKEDILILLTVFIVGLVNYFYFMSNVALTHDGITYGPLHIAGGWDFDLGRPLLLIFDRLRGGLVSPVIIVFFALIYLSISVMLLRRIFPIKKKISIFLLSLLVVLFPSFTETSMFLFCFDSYSLSFMLSILSLYFIKNKKYILSIIFNVISLGIYQTYIGVLITGVVLLFIMDILDNKQSIKDFITKMFVVFTGLVSYFVSLKVAMRAFGRTLADYKGASGFGLNTILELPNSIMNAYKDFYSFFFLEDVLFNEYYSRNIINIIILVLICLLLFFIFKKLNKNQKILLVLALIILPITVNIMDLIACTTTINLVTCTAFFMIYLLFIILFEKHSNINIIKSISTIMIFILCYTYLLSNNGTFHSRVDTFNNYYSQSNYYLTVAKSLDNYSSDLPWMFNNNIHYKSPVSVASNGLFATLSLTYEGYLGIVENQDFYRRFFAENIVVVPEERYREIIKMEEYQSMKKGDVKIIDGVIVVKVSDIDF